MGWGSLALINIFFAMIFGRYDLSVLQRVLFLGEIGFIFTHMMRQVILRSSILTRSLQQQVISLIFLSIVFSFFITCIITPYYHFYELSTKPYKQLFIENLVTVIMLMFFWTTIYFMYHYVLKTRKQQMDTLKLEALVKALELKTIKAHINPHFIFNALNGIRALIDENPARARRAVTELSNILRSSLSADKAETVSLEDELKIVKDYLALENMRFEDRLKVEYDVDGDTLDQQVPPMMLQTLVENAIKHGISKQMKGGVVRIVSDFKGEYHRLCIQNTGHLNGRNSSSGFGLSSTRDRLGLLYGDKASFEIRQAGNELVEAKVLIPLINQVAHEGNYN